MGVKSDDLPIFGAFLMVIALCVFIIFYGCKICLKSRKQDLTLKHQLMCDYGLSPDAANRMLKLCKSRAFLLHPSNLMHTKSIQISKSRLHEIFQFEFFTIARWAKRVENLKQTSDQNIFYQEINRLINDMEQYANNYNLENYDTNMLQTYTACQFNPMQVNCYRITKQQLAEIYLYEFFVLAQFVRRLQALKQVSDLSAIRHEVNELIHEMEKHAGNYQISEYIQSEIMQICQVVPELSLQEFDNYFKSSRGYPIYMSAGGGGLGMYAALRGGGWTF